MSQPTPKAVTLLPPKPVLKPVVKPVAKPVVTTPTVSKAPRPASKPTVSTPTQYKRVMTGIASWYDNGTTAMRLPRGTHIKICGAKTCVTRVVRDWGPARYLAARIVDMTPEDFVKVTGLSLSAGLAPVKVYIY